MITRLWANRQTETRFLSQLDFVPSWLKVWIIEWYGKQKQKQKIMPNVLFLKRVRKKQIQHTVPKQTHVINVVILTRLVCTSKYILPYTDCNGSTETPQVPQCWVATLIGVCVCLCVSMSETRLSQCFVDHWAVCERQRAAVCVWEWATEHGDVSLTLLIIRKLLFSLSVFHNSI